MVLAMYYWVMVHAGCLRSTQEVGVAFGCHLGQVLRFFRALQISRVLHNSIVHAKAWTDCQLYFRLYMLYGTIFQQKLKIYSVVFSRLLNCDVLLGCPLKESKESLKKFTGKFRSIKPYKETKLFWGYMYLDCIVVPALLGIWLLIRFKFARARSWSILFFLYKHESFWWLFEYRCMHCKS